MNGKRKEWIERGGDLVVASFAVAAAMLLLSGCGQEKSASSQPVTESSSAAVVETERQAVTSGGTSAVNASLSQGSTANAPAEGLPPEIALAELDTLVTPGQPISITVYGTPDVSEVALFDGVNDHQALVHDASHDTWSVDYRVPLRPKSDRIGLSLTAKNAANRWRRVWVFLKVGQPVTGETRMVQQAGTDSVVTR
jgi:hypothetical protein